MAVRELATGQFRGAGGRFIPNPIGIAAIASGPQMLAMLGAEVKKIEVVAKELARQEAYQTGDYYRGIRSSSGYDKIDGKPTAVGRVNAFDFKSGWIEFGSIKIQPPRRILQRAAEAVGHHLTVGRNVRRIFGSGLERVLRLAN